MSSPKDQALVTFHDVAACFSAEEWGLLEDWQKEMYENVMREIHAALLAMGFEIMNPDVLLRINGAKDVCAGICDSGGPVRGSARRAVDPDRLINVKQEPGSGANACRRRGSRAQAPAASSPDILLRIKREERLSLSEVSESSSCHSPGEPVITSVFSLQTERTKDVGGMHHGNRPKAQATQLQKQFLSLPDIKKQPDFVKLSEGDSAPGRTAVTPREQFASPPIKQEQPDYATASAGDSVPGALRETPTQDSDTDAPPPSPGNLAPNSHDIPATSPPSLGAHRVRKYTNRELEVLVHMVMEIYPKLFGKEAAKTPNAVKDAIWQAVADEITALGVDVRTPDKVKKRWLSAKRTMKKKVGEAAQHIAETGRRPPAYLRLTPYEQRLRDFFMPDFRENIQWSRNEVETPEEDDDDPTVKAINADKTRLNQPPEEREAQERTIQDDGTDYTLNGSIYKWSSERPYRCHECAKTFSDPARFLRHRIGHTGGRPYRCRHCVKTFRQPYELMVHQRVHTGEKPYHCTVCGKKFIKNSILKVHQRIHTGERPYKCPQCSRSFVQSHHLKSHQKTHTADRLQSRHETSPALRKPVG